MDFPPIKFREEYTQLGGLVYWAACKEAEEVLEFLGDDRGWIGEHKGEKAFAWLESLGHEVIILEEPKSKTV